MTNLLAWVLAAGAAVAGAADRPRPQLERYTSAATRDLKLPFSEAVRVGDLLFLSGQIGLQPGTRVLVPGGIVPETRQTLENVKRILEAYGSSMDRVAKCTVFLADMADWPKVNEVYVTYFGAALPARSALGASGLALGARVEVECIGVAGP
ncbi:MAG TPA: Rid family detoxifying hydrolase [Vicinamibacteria bacterium]|nr:Rid family detoxifying hydrolase [Vicinamibacteria bacterium]